ncbi:MAG TPA: succinate dehydrogenase assembly factor 2 [Steroidobacteraceae bacterium]|jgi:antitoxin CptB
MSTSPMPAEQDRTHIARLRWHCRRGMRELDVVLQRYLQECYPGAAPQEQQAFERLLELQDPQLLAYLMRQDVPDPELAHVIARLTDPGT